MSNAAVIDKTPELPGLIKHIDELLEAEVVALVTRSARGELVVVLPAEDREYKRAVLDALCNVDWNELRQRLCGDTPT